MSDGVGGHQQLRLLAAKAAEGLSNAHYDNYGFQPILVFDDAARLVGHAVYQRKTRNSRPPLAKQQALPAKRSGTMDGAPQSAHVDLTNRRPEASNARATQESHNAAVGDIFGFPR